MRKTLQINKFKTQKALISAMNNETDDIILSGTLKEIKKLGLQQGNRIGVADIQALPETIQAKDFKDRESIDKHVMEEFGGNLTLNRLSGHSIEGLKEELDILKLSPGANIWGLSVKQTD